MYKVDAVGRLREAADPGVITRDTLVSLVIDQGPKNEAGRLFLEDGIELDKVKEIRIEFLNILNIDNLWMLRGLVKLTLSHNIIERIENLDELVHLRELDLSFNHIRIMENLNNLERVEILLLYDNEIAVVQGIDNLKRLTILNIGNNKIGDWEHVTYLRNFDALRSLNTCENPCVEIDGYTDYLFAFVPQLLYYRYRMISESERQSAIDKHYRTISNLEENETKERAELALQRELEDKFALLSLSYVEYLDGDCLFQQMFSRDEEGKTLSAINQDTRDTFEEYGKHFSAKCRELYELGLQEHSKRTEEMRLFELAVNEGKEEMQNRSRRIVDEVLERKTEIFANIKSVTESLIGEERTETADDVAAKAKELFSEFNDLLSDARNRLMYEETTLHDRIEDINEVFRSNITDMVDSFLEIARGHFSRLRDAAVEYSDAVNESILCYLNDLAAEGTDLPASLSSLCGDRDTLAAALVASKNTHLRVIDERENRLTSRLGDWLEEYTDRLVADEDKRSRRQILEISHFFEFQQEELNTLGLPLPLDLPLDLDLEDVAALEN